MSLLGLRPQPQDSKPDCPSAPATQVPQAQPVRSAPFSRALSAKCTARSYTSWPSWDHPCRRDKNSVQGFRVALWLGKHHGSVPSKAALQSVLGQVTWPPHASVSSTAEHLPPRIGGRLQLVQVTGPACSWGAALVTCWPTTCPSDLLSASGPASFAVAKSRVSDTWWFISLKAAGCSGKSWDSSAVLPLRSCVCHLSPRPRFLHL